MVFKINLPEGPESAAIAEILGRMAVKSAVSPWVRFSSVHETLDLLAYSVFTSMLMAALLVFSVGFLVVFLKVMHTIAAQHEDHSNPLFPWNTFSLLLSVPGLRYLQSHFRHQLYDAPLPPPRKRLFSTFSQAHSIRKPLLDGGFLGNLWPWSVKRRFSSRGTGSSSANSNSASSGAGSDWSRNRGNREGLEKHQSNLTKGNTNGIVKTLRPNEGIMPTVDSHRKKSLHKVVPPPVMTTVKKFEAPCQFEPNQVSKDLASNLEEHSFSLQYDLKRQKDLSPISNPLEFVEKTEDNNNIVQSFATQSVASQLTINLGVAFEHNFEKVKFSDGDSLELGSTNTFSLKLDALDESILVSPKVEAEAKAELNLDETICKLNQLNKESVEPQRNTPSKLFADINDEVKDELMLGTIKLNQEHDPTPCNEEKPDKTECDSLISPPALETTSLEPSSRDRVPNINSSSSFFSQPILIARSLPIYNNFEQQNHSAVQDKEEAHDQLYQEQLLSINLHSRTLAANLVNQVPLPSNSIMNNHLDARYKVNSTSMTEQTERIANPYHHSQLDGYNYGRGFMTSLRTVNQPLPDDQTRSRLLKRFPTDTTESEDVYLNSELGISSKDDRFENSLATFHQHDHLPSQEQASIIPSNPNNLYDRQNLGNANSIRNADNRSSNKKSSAMSIGPPASGNYRQQRINSLTMHTYGGIEPGVFGNRLIGREEYSNKNNNRRPKEYGEEMLYVGKDLTPPPGFSQRKRSNSMFIDPDELGGAIGDRNNKINDEACFESVSSSTIGRVFRASKGQKFNLKNLVVDEGRKEEVEMMQSQINENEGEIQRSRLLSWMNVSEESLMTSDGSTEYLLASLSGANSNINGSGSKALNCPSNVPTYTRPVTSKSNDILDGREFNNGMVKHGVIGSRPNSRGPTPPPTIMMTRRKTSPPSAPDPFRNSRKW